MKRLLTAVLLLLMLPSAGFAKKDSRKIPVNKVMTEIRNWNGTEGFEAVILDSLTFSLVRMLAGIACAIDEDDDTKEAMSMMKGMKRMAVVDYSECDTESRENFNKRISALLDGIDLLMEAREDGVTMRIYGQAGEDGKTLSDFIMFSPEESALICLAGKMSMENIAKLTK